MAFPIGPCSHYRPGDRVRAVPSASDRSDLGTGIVWEVSRERGYIVHWITRREEGGGWDDRSLTSA